MSENTEELKSQLNNPEEEEEEKEEKEKGEKGEEEGEEEKEEKGAGEGSEKFQMPDKFKGKSAEEIAKSYTELEGMIDKKAQEKAEEIAKQKKEKEGEEEEEELEETKHEEEPPMKDGKIDYASMTPEQFAQWVDRRIELKAEAKAREIISDSRKIRTAVQTEIKEAQTAHPLLKTNADYRELALAIIEAAASKGKTIRLKEACEKVDALVGKKKEIGEEEEEKLKKAKAEVETGGGAAPGGKETEEEEIKKRMLEGSKTGELGGLGV